ncbi:XdhC family protein [Rhodoplanes sp. Z2-YC6860]|uniref:XdhC family protein n=1 Tax=Rhodoplanes sp. Z2-YC6860 TaxID=674703 RepID=UPI0018DC025F|nr:XdhC family protein [Rhodoplanes sp. Z2-YC6860]
MRLAADLIASRQPFALSIVVEAQGSTSARTGAKAVFDAEGTVMAGWVGGGCAESTIAHAAVECLETETPQMVDVDLDDEVLGAGMPCGGRMRVYVEPVIPRPTLWILGHGRVAECLCHLGALLSFDVVVDDVMASADRYPDASRVIADDSDYKALTPASSDFVVIATQHRGDHESLRRLLKNDVGTIALIASRKRTGLVIDYLRDAGFQQSDIDRIRAPAGIELRARTAEEIALSVISEVVLLRRSRTAPQRLEGSTDKDPAPARGDQRHPVTLSLAGQRALRAIGE